MALTKTKKDENLADEINPAGPNTEGQTDAVNSAVASLGKLSFDERKVFKKRFEEIFAKEADVRSVGHDFDSKEYH